MLQHPCFERTVRQGAATLDTGPVYVEILSPCSALGQFVLSYNYRTQWRVEVEAVNHKNLLLNDSVVQFRARETH